MLIITLGLCLEGLRGLSLIDRLDRIEPDSSPTLPTVSIIVAARNEEKNIRAGVESLLKIDFPGKEVVVVNDRSTDRTPFILSQLATEYPSIRILTLNSLPPGWLGKNYALSEGAKNATGEYLLFTDADVVMEPSVLKRAIHYVRDKQLDHLAIGPAALMPGMWLNMFMVGFTIFFNIFTRPWEVRNPKSRAHIGIGAFNLVRRTTYHDMGGHARIALRPDDDLKLGKLVKLNHSRSDFLIGASLIHVEWYSSVRELIHGLEKNMFAGCDYRLSVVLAGALAQILLFQWPLLAVIIFRGPVQYMCGMIVVLQWIMGIAAARSQRLSKTYALGLPLASIMFVFLMLRTTWLNVRDKGIYWRDTFYPLDQLKGNQV